MECEPKRGRFCPFVNCFEILAEREDAFEWWHFDGTAQEGALASQLSHSAFSPGAIRLPLLPDRCVSECVSVLEVCIIAPVPELARMFEKQLTYPYPSAGRRAGRRSMEPNGPTMLCAEVPGNNKLIFDRRVRRVSSRAA